MNNPIQIGQIYKARKENETKGRKLVQIHNVTYYKDGRGWIGAHRWIETKQKFSSSGFGMTPESFLESYELVK